MAARALTTSGSCPIDKSDASRGARRAKSSRTRPSTAGLGVAEPAAQRATLVGEAPTQQPGGSGCSQEDPEALGQPLGRLTSRSPYTPCCDNAFRTLRRRVYRLVDASASRDPANGRPVCTIRNPCNKDRDECRQTQQWTLRRLSERPPGRYSSRLEDFLKETQHRETCGMERFPADWVSRSAPAAALKGDDDLSAAGRDAMGMRLDDAAGTSIFDLKQPPNEDRFADGRVHGRLRHHGHQPGAREAVVSLGLADAEACRARGPRVGVGGPATAADRFFSSATSSTARTASGLRAGGGALRSGGEACTSFAIVDRRIVDVGDPLLATFTCPLGPTCRSRCRCRRRARPTCRAVGAPPGVQWAPPFWRGPRTLSHLLDRQIRSARSEGVEPPTF